MQKLAAIVGPTAAGKTRIAIEVAKRINARIISCDSMQVYRGMDIGTAKAGLQERELIPHYMVDIVEANEEFSVADYQNQVKSIIERLNKENTIPLLVGGTGLYYQAVVDNYHFFPLQSRNEVREKWKDIVNNNGLQFAYEALGRIDPDYAEKISPQDEKRIIRAMEVYELTGKPFSQQQSRDSGTYNLAVAGLYLDREVLYQRINSRVDEMICQGLIDEVIALKKKPGELSSTARHALGYKQVLNYLDGVIDREDMIAEIKQETRRYAKRQYTWFKRDERIRWFNVMEYSEEELGQNICSYIEGQFNTL
ncbi:MAG: tRNA (adenosine(37)-N6)-dimethylallyltransferase MiaA [Syntrophomonadaceae bacterium]|nr:tRNA (adenosine(37)-N6)-dimethylallyltransferase MiaA [Syntrophomonadaceae bacterium]